MRRVALLTAGCVLAAAGAAWAATVTPLGLNESRGVALSGSYSPFPSHLNVILRLGGEDLKSVTSVGKIKISAAKDDTGKALATSPFGSPNDLMKKLSEWEISKQDGSFVYEFWVGAPAREAKKLTIKAEVTVLSGGEPKEAKVANTVAPGAVEDAALKAAEVTLTRIKPGGPGDTNLVFELGGNVDAISKVKVVGKDGKEINSNYNLFDNMQTKAKMLHVIAFGAKAGDEYTAVITVLAGQKKTMVPVEIKDATLP